MENLIPLGFFVFIAVIFGIEKYSEYKMAQLEKRKEKETDEE